MSTEEQSDNPAEEPEEEEDEKTDEEEFNEWSFGQMTEILGIARGSLTDTFDSVTSIESESDSPDDGMFFELVKDGDRYRIGITPVD